MPHDITSFLLGVRQLHGYMDTDSELTLIRELPERRLILIDVVYNLSSVYLYDRSSVELWTGWNKRSGREQLEGF